MFAGARAAHTPFMGWAGRLRRTRPSSRDVPSRPGAPIDQPRSPGGIARRCLATAAAALLLVASHAGAAGLVVTGEVRGGIGPASAAYVERLLVTAAEREADLVVLALDTPGGLDTSMREMIQAILGSPVPVAIYVSPRGARAASAGTYLLYAAHLAAMAPGTNVGAATPVAIGIGGGGDDERGRKPSPRDPAADRSDGPRPDEGAAARDPSRQKAVRDAVAYLQGLADLRGRNAEWARKAVEDADSLPAREALKQGVVDIVAVDLADLLRQADGRSVEAGTSTRVLAVAGASVEAVAANWKERLLAAISNPNLALLLLMAGLYGLLIEFYVPGTGVPGVIGAIALLLGLYGLALLPVTLAGAALLLLGIALMVAEGFAPSFGALGIGGVLAFAAGGVLLLDDVPGFEVSWQVVVPLAVANALAVAAVAALALRARRRPVVSGVESMLGTTVEALEDFERDGWVLAHGERWHARTSAPLRRGGRARITGVDGLLVSVEPCGNDGKGA